MQKQLVQFSKDGRNYLRPKLKKHPKLHNALISMHRAYCSLTSFLHVLPDYYIIGVAKSGTSSLYECLVQHLCVEPASTKEIHFFDRYPDRGLSWYKVCFPFKLHKFFVKKISRSDFITGEATPRYIEHPKTAEKILELTPNAKLIVMLRNPIDRAYSHWNMNYEVKKETLSFEKSIEIEKKRIAGEYEKMLKNESYYSLTYYHFSYLERSTYANYLEKWFKVFPRKQFLIINADVFFKKPQYVYNKVLNFLDLPDWKLKHFKKYRIGRYIEPIKPDTRKKLVEYFRPHNERLYKLIGEDFNWDKE